ncbi:MAG: serine/threonine protein kinase [Deltaproteobacteria bacterium]|nr:serine/threonine protein kinase [Deltaproteobacteria bacterium]
MKICASCGAVWDDVELCSYDQTLLPEAIFPGPRILVGRYLLEQKIAAGAMGVVVRATHLQLGSTVAVKLMLPHQAGIRIGQARFFREAQILGLIKHPNAVFVMDFGVCERGNASVPFLVTEFLDGKPLSSLLEEEGRLDVELVENIISSICDAVHEAHEVGVIHRDIKPSNIFLEKLRDGSHVVKVLDFGIAKLIERDSLSSSDAGADFFSDESSIEANQILTLGRSLGLNIDDEEQLAKGEEHGPKTRLERRAAPADGSSLSSANPSETLTEAGWMIGTLHYMAPEQMTGDPVNSQTDLYSIATLTFRMLAGHLPYDGPDEDIIDKKLTNETPSLLGRGLENVGALDVVLQKCLALDATDRPQDFLELSRALKAACPAETLETETIRLDVNLKTLTRLAQEIQKVPGDTDSAEEIYRRRRDLLLLLGRAAEQVRLRLPEPGSIEAPTGDLLRKVLVDVTGLLRGSILKEFRAGNVEGFPDYLGAIWTRISGQLNALKEKMGHLVEPLDERKEHTNPFAKNPFLDAEVEEDDLVDSLLQQLLAEDELGALDAFQRLRKKHNSWLVSVLTEVYNQEILRKLCRGLWRFAPALLVDELLPSFGGTRLLPLLLRHEGQHEVQGFVSLGKAFAWNGNEACDIFSIIESLDAEDQTKACECLMWHPRQDVVQEVLQRLKPSQMWHLIASEQTSVKVVHDIFENIKLKVGNEYLKVFFLCSKETLLRSPPEFFLSAFQLLQSFFHISCFHEDDVFEDLLETDRILRQRFTMATKKEPEHLSHVEIDAGIEGLYQSRTAFVAKGTRDAMPPSSFKDVPLPILRRIAREGHFLFYFISHVNERVARETLPHLMRLEDVTRFLRVPTIQRIVLLELAKNKRFFRTDVARQALLQNPKTPAVVARGYLPLLPHEQVRLLAKNRHIGAEVRQLAQRAVDRRKRQS